MLVTKLARVYAKALIDLAKEQKSVDVIKDDMDLISNTLQGSRELRQILKSPIVKEAKKKSILIEIFQGKISDLSERFIGIVVGHRREASIVAMCAAYEAMFLEHNGIEKVTVTTAYQLSQEEVVEVIKKAEALSGKKVQLEEEVDESIIGGMILRVKDQRFNGSIAHQLKRLKREFQSNHYIKEF
jgi:F-type H+-transporting ATPase subunit delta